MRLLSPVTIMLAMTLLAPVCDAQVRGTPAPEGQRHTGRSAIVAPQGHAGVMPAPIGVSPAPAPAFPAPTPIGVPPMLPVPGANNGAGNSFHHHHHDSDDFARGAYPVYVPYPVVVDPYSMYQAPPDQAEEETDDPPVAQGPTVFERRTPGDVTATQSFAAPSVEEPASAASDASPAQPESASSQPVQPQEPNVLVFRDGHQLEVQNYAIVGDFLYDFTPGHTRKVPLSQLDLPATVKANDDRGLDFTLPGSKGGS